jgi:hypothetical protein
MVQNKKSTQMGQNKANAKGKTRSGNPAKLSAPSPSAIAFGSLPTNVRTNWVTRGPGDIEPIQYPHRWVAKEESDIFATASDLHLVIDLHSYTEQLRSEAELKAITFWFSPKISGECCLVELNSRNRDMQMTNAQNFIMKFSTLQAFNFKAGEKLGVQCIAPSPFDSTDWSDGKVALVFKFSETTEDKKVIMRRKVWAHSSAIKDEKLPSNILGRK